MCGLRILTVSMFCKIMLVRDRLLARILYRGYNVHRCTEILHVPLQMLKLFADILTFILAFSMLFVTPLTPAVYSRDHLLSLRSHAIQLNLDQRALIVQLGLSCRECRAGGHLRCCLDQSYESARGNPNHHRTSCCVYKQQSADQSTMCRYTYCRTMRAVVTDTNIL